MTKRVIKRRPPMTWGRALAEVGVFLLALVWGAAMLTIVGVLIYAAVTSFGLACLWALPALAVVGLAVVLVRNYRVA